MVDLTELSLNVLDVAQNSVRAEASLIEIKVEADAGADRLTIIIKDDGCGMTPEQVKQVEDPFFTTRTTRKVGLGVPFFKYSAECTGGSFEIVSEPGKGTTVTAVYVMSHIDRMPLGDMESTMHTLITMNKDIDFIYEYSYNGEGFILDTRQFREILGEVAFDEPEVSAYIKEYLVENRREADGGIAY